MDTYRVTFHLKEDITLSTLVKGMSLDHVASDIGNRVFLEYPHHLARFKEENTQRIFTVNPAFILYTDYQKIEE